MSILDKLNEEQKKAGEVVDGPVLVTAGAGSGKTRLLTHRIAHLVLDLNVDPSNILAITFTNKAGNEMKERLAKLIPDISSMWIHTFHSMCGRILRIHAEKVELTNNFTIYADSEQQRVVKRILQQDPEFVSLEKNKLTVNNVIWHISNAKNNLFSPDEYLEVIKHSNYFNIIVRAYREYEIELKRSNAIDFDDMLIKVYELFTNYKDVLEYYQEKFRYIHVDEFQDTNLVQYRLVKMLGEKYHNVFVVGDEDQCIYSWRGAKFGNVQDFINDNKDTIHVFKLEQNYRSTKNILKTANAVILNNTNRLEKRLWTENDNGEPVSYVSPYSDLEEAEYVATTIKSMVTEKGYHYNDFAILMRINSLSRVLEEKFLNYQVPYEVYGGFKFYERKEVKDVLAYLKVISNTKDNDSFVRCLEFPKKGIGEASIEKILTISKEMGMTAYEICVSGFGLPNAVLKKVQPFILELKQLVDEKNNLSLSTIIAEVLKRFEIKNAFSRLVEEELTKILNIEQLETSLKEFEDANDNATLDSYLESITLSRDIDNYDESEECVSLMTIHSAKGLEFKVVFVVGLVDGVLPLSRAIYSNDPNELEEERRLMYVAITRAKEKLILSRPTTRFNFETRRTEGTVISRFLKEANIVKEEKAQHSFENYDNFGSGYYIKTSNNRNSFVDKSASILNEDDVVEEKKQTVDNNKLQLYKSYSVGTKVFHKNFGKGEVIVACSDPVSAFVTIKFENVGVKTLSLKFAPLEIIEGE